MATAHEQQNAPDTAATKPLPPVRQSGGGRAIWILVGIALILLGGGAIVISGSYDEPREVEALGRVVPVNEGATNGLDLSAHNSPALVRNPADASNVVVGNRIDDPRYSCAVHVSFDGGGHWAQTPIPVPPGEEPKCYAPDVAFGPNGTLYFAYTTLKGRANAPHAVWLSRSRDGGKTLSRPNQTPLPVNSFQPRLAADPSKAGQIYLTWLAAGDLGLYSFTQPGNPIQVMRSDDNGNTWTEPVQVSSSDRERVVAPSPAIGPDGQLYVVYLDLDGDRLDYHGEHRGKGGPPFDRNWSLVLARSTDDGDTWEESVVADGVVPAERFIVYSPPYPAVAVDRDSGRIYAGFTDARLGDPDVYVWSLPSGGEDWSGPTRVNDTAEEDGSAQYLPALSVAPDGRLDVLYYDRRDDSKNVLNQVSYQASFDQGDSFTDRVNLSDRAFSSRVGFGSERGLPDLGNRLGLVSGDDGSLAVWTDTRAGTPRTGKQDLARGIVAVNDPPRLAGWLEFLLRWGGIVTILAGAYLVLARGVGLGTGRAHGARSSLSP
ncbi:MAG: sialidase family protein [Solirubrobacterales bacterium]